MITIDKGAVDVNGATISNQTILSASTSSRICDCTFNLRASFAAGTTFASGAVTPFLAIAVLPGGGPPTPAELVTWLYYFAPIQADPVSTVVLQRTLSLDVSVPPMIVYPTAIIRFSINRGIASRINGWIHLFHRPFSAAPPPAARSGRHHIQAGTAFSVIN